jgi:hypothetical protein
LTVCIYWRWYAGDRERLNSGIWCCSGLRSTALGYHNNCSMLARLKRRGEGYQPIIRAARTSLAATKARSTTSIVKANCGHVHVHAYPVSLRSKCSVAERAFVGCLPRIVISCSWVRVYGLVGFDVIDISRKGGYGNSRKQNDDGMHFDRRSYWFIGLLRANVDLRNSNNRSYMIFHSYESS